MWRAAGYKSKSSWAVRVSSTVALLPFLSGLWLLTPAHAALNERAAIELVPETDHRERVSALTFSKDGSLLAGGSRDRTIKLREADSGRLLRSLTGGTQWISDLVFMENGARLLSLEGEKDTFVRMWDTITGALLDSRACDFNGVGALFSPDGALIASLNQPESDLFTLPGDEPEAGWIDIFDTTTLARVGHITNLSQEVGAMSFSSSGAHLMVGFEDGDIRKFDVESGRAVADFMGHKDSVLSMALSADDRLMATGSNDGSVMVWNLGDGVPEKQFTPDAPVHAVAISADNALIAASDESGGVTTWSMSDGREISHRQIKDDVMLVLAFSDSGARLAMGGLAGVQIQDVDKIEIGAETVRRSVPAVKAIISADETRMAMLDKRGALSLWNLVDGALVAYLDAGESEKMISFFGSDTLDIRFSIDGAVLMSISSRKTRLWDSTNGRLLSDIGKPETEMFSNGVAGIDGFRVASLHQNDCEEGVYAGTCGAGILIKNPRTQYALHEVKLEGRVFSIRGLSPKGDRIVVSRQRGLDLIDIPGGRRVITDAAMHGENGLTSWATEAVFSKNGNRLVTGHLDGSIRLWDAGSGKILHKQESHSAAIWRLALSDDGHHLVSVDRLGRLLVFDTRQWQTLLSMATPAKLVSSLAMNPDGTRILITRSDGMVDLININNSLLNMRFVSSMDGEWVSMAGPGFFNTSQEGIGLLNLVRGHEVLGIDQVYQAMYRPDLVHEALAGDPEGMVMQAAGKIDLNSLVDSGPPPGVTFIAPVGKRVREPAIGVTIQLADQGGGWGRVEWRVNGTTMGVDRELDPGKQTIRLTREIKLLTGENRIEVVAYNASDLVASNPAKLSVHREAVPQAAQPDLHILTIGVNRYWDNRLVLNYAVPDAQAIAEALQNAGKSLYARVFSHQLFDEDVTEENLDALFTRLALKIGTEDVFLFFIAGHGKTVDGQYYFLPRDFRYRNSESIQHDGIGQNQWQSWFSKIPARKSLLMYDTCESGSLTGARIRQRGLERVSSFDKLTRATGRAVLSAATDDGPAIEGYRGHGVFTYTILDALAAADANDDKLIELTEIASHVDQLVPKISMEAFGFRQVPQMRIVGSNFPIAARLLSLDKEAFEPIPMKPTHVLISPTTIFVTAGGKSAGGDELTAGTLVRVIKSDGGWLLIARRGRKLGYVRSDTIVRMQ